MLSEDRSLFIDDLELASPKATFPKRRVTKGLGAAPETGLLTEGKEQAFFSDKSLVSFVSGVSVQNRQDVLNTTLFAQLAANKKFPGEDELLDWYEFFAQTLGKLGWVMEGKGVATFESKQELFEVENVIIDILTEAFGSAYIAVIKKVLESIKKLSADDKKLAVFEANVHSHTKGCFQIATAVETNGAVAMQLGTFLLTTTSQIYKILFFSSAHNETTLKYDSQKGTFNTDIYSRIRQKVSDQLGDKLEANLAEISI